MNEVKFNNADSVTIWSTGKPLRKFLYSDDLTQACVFLFENVDYNDIAVEDKSGTVQAHINVGSDKEKSIRQLAEILQKVVGFINKLVFDASKPDGTPGMLIDSTRLQKLGWESKIELENGIDLAYKNFSNYSGYGESNSK